MKRLWVIVVGIIVALILHNLNDYLLVSTAQNTQSPRADNAISYYFSDFNTLRTDHNGQPLYQLSGNHLTHRDQLQQSLINNPVITQQRYSDQHSSTLRADKAVMDHQQDRLELTGHVSYQKQQGTGNTLHLQTDELEYRPNEQQLQTDRAILINNNSTVVQSTGMTAHLNDDNLELHSNVRITYETH